jgi:hypothetical protein
MPCHAAIMPCISPTVRADAKSRCLGAFVSALHVAVSAQAVCYCNLTPGHRIPSLHSLPYSSRPATNAALNAMAHTAVVRAAQATTKCISTKHPPSLRRIAADTRAHCICGFPSEGKTATPSQPSQPVRASEPANGTQRNASQPQGLTTAPL